MDSTSQKWIRFLQHHPEAHILQTLEWGILKSRFGWDVDWVIGPDCGAQILFRKLPLGLTIGYIPKGPVGNPDIDFWQLIDDVCKRHHAVFIKIEADAVHSEISYQYPFDVIESDPVQPRNTSILDLNAGVDTLLSGMKPKTRYNIQLARKKDVVITRSSDVRSFSDLMMTTGERDQFGIHHHDYYQMAYQLFHPNDACELFIASYQDDPIAGVMVFRNGKRCWYFYGASSNLERNRMPAYLLQWEAIQWAISQGCESYDLWGIPDFPESMLESEFMNRSDGLWGVYRFKRGFNGKLVRSMRTVDWIFRPQMYKLFQLANKIRRSGGFG